MPSQSADAATAAILRLTRDRPLFAAFLAGSLALHLALLAVVIWTERAPPLKPDTAREISVDLVTAPPSGPQGDGGAAQATSAKTKPDDMLKPATPPKPEAKPPAAEKPAPPAAKPSETPPKPAAQNPPAPPPPAPKPLTPTLPKPAPATPEPPKPEPPKPEPAKPEQPQAAPPAPKPPVAEPEKPPQAAPQSPPQPVAPPPPQPAPQPVQPPPSFAASEGTPQGIMQDDSPAVAVPAPSEDGDEVVSYQTLVFGMLELKKEFPEDAKRRGAYGTASVAFELNDDGSVKSEKLVRSSGDAALDVESLALVQRAAPFPKPPPGARKAFAADIVFPPPR